MYNVLQNHRDFHHHHTEKEHCNQREYIDKVLYTAVTKSCLATGPTCLVQRNTKNEIINTRIFRNHTKDMSQQVLFSIVLLYYEHLLMYNVYVSAAAKAGFWVKSCTL